MQGTVWAHFPTSNTKVTNVLSTMQCEYRIRLRLRFLVHAATSCAPPTASWEKRLASMQMETQCLERLLAPRTSKPPWRSKGPFTPIMITITILASTLVHDNVLFIISVHCSFVVCCFKCTSSLKSDSDWVFIVHLGLFDSEILNWFWFLVLESTL